MFRSRPSTRRRLITDAARLAALSSAATLMPPNVRKLMAQTPKRAGSLKDIKHVVLLMQENRSFDHYFGTLAGVRGFNDPDALTLKNGKSVFYQPDPDNYHSDYLLPFHLDTKTTNAQKLPSTSHAWNVQHIAWNGGRMDQWLLAHRLVDKENAPYVMGYFKREDIPFHYALADAFTICDGYHCSVLGPTGPNRLYYMTGMIDPDGTGGGPITSNIQPEEGFGWKTYPERLEEAGVSWRIYQCGKHGRPFNQLQHFRQFMDAPHSSALYRKGVPEPSEGEFEYDALHDRLPTVSWLCPPGWACEHPDHMPAAGAEFIAQKLNALAANPDVWAKTAFILNYDENDGLFDHVPPPFAPRGTPGEYVDKWPIGAGFRVPCIIISPWTVGGWVCSETFDHTSTLQFLERITGVREPNITQWRRDTFGDLTSAFRFGAMPEAALALPPTADLLKQAEYATEHFSDPVFPDKHQVAPVQEAGTRKRVDQ